jgi:hypothetical protein
MSICTFVDSHSSCMFRLKMDELLLLKIRKLLIYFWLRITNSNYGYVKILLILSAISISLCRLTISIKFQTITFIKIQTLKRVSELSANIKVTVRLLIQMRRANLIGFNLATSFIGAVL